MISQLRRRDMKNPQFQLNDSMKFDEYCCVPVQTERISNIWVGSNIM